MTSRRTLRREKYVIFLLSTAFLLSHLHDNRVCELFLKTCLLYSFTRQLKSKTFSPTNFSDNGTFEDLLISWNFPGILNPLKNCRSRLLTSAGTIGFFLKIYQCCWIIIKLWLKISYCNILLIDRVDIWTKGIKNSFPLNELKGNYFHLNLKAVFPLVTWNI